MAYVFRTKDKNGKFHAKYRFQYRDSSGKKRTGTGNSSKSETKAMAEKIENEHSLVRKGLKEPPDKTVKYRKKSVEEPIKEYLEWGEIQGGRGGKPWGKGHLKNRVRHLNWWKDKLNLQLLGELSGILSLVKKETTRMIKEGVTGKTVSNYVDSLRSFCAYCVDNEYIKDNPLAGSSIKINTDPKVKRRCLTIEEINGLISVVDKDYYWLLYMTAIMTGLRANELRQLQVKDISLDKGGLELQSDWTKNRKEGFQIVPVDLLRQIHDFAKSNRAKELYRKFKTDENSYPKNPVFYVPHDTTYVLNKYLNKAKIAKVNDKGSVDFHALRTTYINLVIGSGADSKTAQELARHSSVDITYNTYGRTKDSQLRTSVEQVASTILAQCDSGLGVSSSGLKCKKVLGAGVEPALVSQHGPQPCASANSATRAAMAQKVI